MPNCCALKVDGAPCGRVARDQADPPPGHLHFCNQHNTTYRRRVIMAGGHHEPGRCMHTVANNRWCPNMAEAEGPLECGRHRAVRVAREQRREDERTRATMIREGVELLLTLAPLRTWQETVTILMAYPDRRIAFAIGLRYYHRPEVRALDVPQWQGNAPIWRFALYWDWAMDGAQGPPPEVNVAVIVPQAPAALPQLARLATDAQNVHTAPVSAQTNAGMEKILKTTIPKEQQTEKCMVASWVTILPTVSWNTILKTSTDVNQWFNTKTCRVENDNLYRNMLRGLVAMINRTDEELKQELFKRLWEECREATGMCCEGHITRLCNVMVGFDDAFQPPVALGDLMQQKMAAIAGLDVDEEEKRRQANAWFDEVAVPVAERAAWLEAF